MQRELIRSDSQGIPVDDDCVYNFVLFISRVRQ